jgi:DNA polymerase-1
MDSTRAKAREQGYVETLWGRRLYLPEINSRQIPRQRAAERAAINAPLQGSAADIIKLAMIKLDRWLSESHVDAKMIMQVHDELVFEVAEKDVEVVANRVRKQMAEVVNLHTPLKIAIGVGGDWDEAAAH